MNASYRHKTKRISIQNHAQNYVVSVTIMTKPSDICLFTALSQQYFGTKFGVPCVWQLEMYYENKFSARYVVTNIVHSDESRPQPYRDWMNLNSNDQSTDRYRQSIL